MATTKMPETPYTPAKDIEYPKPDIPGCWTPEPVFDLSNADNPA